MISERLEDSFNFFISVDLDAPAHKRTQRERTHDSPQSNGKLIPLQHTQIQQIVRVRQITDPHTPITSRFRRTLLRPSSKLDSVDRPPNRGERSIASFQADALHCDRSLVFGAAYRQFLRVNTEETLDMRQRVLRLSVRLVKGKVDIRRETFSDCSFSTLSASS